MLRKQQRSFWGEHYGEVVGLWLNHSSKAGGPARKRVQTIFSLLKELARAIKDQSASADLDKLVARLRRALRRYRFRAYVFANEAEGVPYAGFKAELAPGERPLAVGISKRSRPGSRRSRAVTISTSTYEAEVVQNLLELAELGVLEGLRQCAKCSDWYFAKVRSQRFCTMQCQQSAFRSESEFREHRRKYMAEYRRKFLNRSRSKGR
jgi:hypothetical protein